MKTPEGKIFGPATRSELDQWYSEGRMSADCQLRTEDQENWQPASLMYTALEHGTEPTSLPAPTKASDAGPHNPFQATAQLSNIPAFQRPHRGAMVLIFGILGLLTCVIFAILAWILGASDLRGMRDGAVDPSGRGLTQAGMILGIVSCAINAILILLYLGIILLAVAARAMGGI